MGSVDEKLMKKYLQHWYNELSDLVSSEGSSFLKHNKPAIFILINRKNGNIERLGITLNGSNNISPECYCICLYWHNLKNSTDIIESYKKAYKKILVEERMKNMELDFS